MLFYSHERMALFVDGSNLYSASKSLEQIQFNFDHTLRPRRSFGIPRG